MKKPNSRKIMLEAITHVIVAAVAVAVFIGGAFIVKSWDKVMPWKNPFESTQDFPIEVDPQPEDDSQSELPIESTSNVEDLETPKADETQPEEQKEIETNNETDKQDLAYNKDKSELIVSVATEQLGVPFKQGGDSPDEGFDTSGFTYYCVNQAGIEFPRSLKDQLESGAWVTYEELKPGDIVYFSHEVGGDAKFCGVYVGGGLIIYSPVPDDFVKTANITTNYWTTHFVTGLRVTSQTGE